MYLDSGREFELQVTEPTALGHKVTLTDLDAGAEVIEYRVRIGRSRAESRGGCARRPCVGPPVGDMRSVGSFYRGLGRHGP